MADQIRIGAYTRVMLGDVASLNLSSAGCERSGCACGGSALQAQLLQADDQGVQITLPVESWAIVAAAVTRALISTHPHAVAEAADKLDEWDRISQQHHHGPNLMDLLSNAGAHVDGPGEHVHAGFGLGSWIYFGGAKAHCVLDLDSTGAMTFCGRQASQYQHVVPESEADCCKVCSKAMSANH